MKQENKQVVWVGYGLALGAGLGLVAGLLFFDAYLWPLLIGAALGLVVGAIVGLRA